VRYADLAAILACPTCRVHVERADQALHCPACGRDYPVVDGAPILLPGGSIPVTEHQHGLHVRDTYDPWIPRLVLQSLAPDAIVLDMGAGNMALSLPHVIRMDVTLTPYVDVVGDAHALPFLPGIFDFVFSLAVTEHLREPFEAADETMRVLRPGGYVYADCNFVFAYHGYPHHYFNASEQGLEQVFKKFERLRTGVAPFQMPSAAIRMLLVTYLKGQKPAEDQRQRFFRALLDEVLMQPLESLDRYFDEQDALKVAAGVFFFGRSAAARSEVVPEVVQDAWRSDDELQASIPSLFDLGSVPNVMLWAKSEGRAAVPAIDEYFRTCSTFQKAPSEYAEALRAFESLPVIPADYSFIDYADDGEPVTGSVGAWPRFRDLEQRLEATREELRERDRRLADRDAQLRELDEYARKLTAYSEEKVRYIGQLEEQLRAADRRGLGRIRHAARRVLRRE
jgi:uncharacterized protein YbaR (Trm112 family)/SAM-dependent methyltransferase